MIKSCFNIVLVLNIVLIVHFASADIYLHNPRGSNNRLDEAGRARNTATRLFDSQNNNRGGYNVGSLYYYTGSILPIEWTNQHSCGDINSHCEIVLQYACGDDIRDGTTTNRIPADRSRCLDNNCQTDPTYGLQESYEHYLMCTRRQRNGGLYTADQRLRGDTARFTRQNPGGTQYGYECPEERDYYPYWHHSPWRDIAILTNDPTRCSFYKTESANVKDRFECRLPVEQLESNRGLTLPSNESECMKLPGAKWTRQPAWGIDSPVCRTAETTRDNHLGNTAQGKAVMFNWTVPDHLAGEKCVLRVRYNISTGDYDRWSTFAEHNNGGPVEFYKKFGFASKAAADARGFKLVNNPQVQLFGDSSKFKLQLNINTAQFGRVFQDRSHVFHVRARPSSIPSSAEILNLNVRGKRGNIVQVYPAVEYDFVPHLTHAKPGSYVHPQWTGSNTNPANNDGQGLAGTDRSNMLPLHDLAANIPDTNYSQGRNWTLNNGIGDWPLSDLTNLALLSPQPQLGGSMQLLNDAGTYFDLGARRVTNAGSWSFVCTRNNNFSNRSHKGRLVCSSDRSDTHVVDGQAYTFKVTDGTKTLAEVTVPAGAFSSLRYLQLRVTPHSAKAAKTDSDSVYGDTWFTDLLRIDVDGQAGEAFATPLLVSMVTNDGADPTEGHDVQVYRMETEFSSAVSHHGPLKSAEATRVEFRVDRPGVYAARGFANAPFGFVGLIVGLLVAALLISLIVAGIIVHRRNPEFFAEKLRFVQRSTQSKV
ncbi:hypothetical protein BOX15_Mlig021895g1 [Macrostomum lignano]|uniref:Protein DD3-3 n=1 Tax=Macrostomum lignano TaxID=282301 RepID=A0A267F5X1_9PLAT|nr:hypothetical protein BOX15_Mlig021895g1 [Macrostomum lignano]